MAGPLHTFGIDYGIVVFAIAMAWLAVAALAVGRVAHRVGLPFSLTWWSFTFPVGTCVTAADGLALHTGAGVFTVASVLLFAVLVTAWCVVAARTAHGSRRGYLFLPPVSPGPGQTVVGSAGTS